MTNQWIPWKRNNINKNNIIEYRENLVHQQCKEWVNRPWHQTEDKLRWINREKSYKIKLVYKINGTTKRENTILFLFRFFFFLRKKPRKDCTRRKNQPSTHPEEMRGWKTSFWGWCFQKELSEKRKDEIIQTTFIKRKCARSWMENTKEDIYMRKCVHKRVRETNEYTQ